MTKKPSETHEWEGIQWMAYNGNWHGYYTAMYERPGLTYEFLKSVADHFGTTEISVNNDIDKPGCETCDYGSEYGYSLIVYRPTLNKPA